MKGYLSALIIASIIIVILTRCANVGQPTGGPKDVTPPKLINTFPKDQSLNFNDNRVQFTFNEAVKIEDVKKQVIITPPIEEENYVIKVKNNVVTFQLKRRLQPNTTYTFNLGEAVRDITENNKANNIQIGFSTGSFIDSLSIAGKVTRLMQGKPVANAVVGLYLADDTLNIFNKRPLYLTKTDSIGNYRLTNLKNSNYKIYSFIDKNNNLTNEPLTEAFGFKEKIIELDSSIYDLNIKLFRQDIRDLKLQSSRPDGQYFLIKFNKYIKGFELKPDDPQIDLYHSLVEENKTIRIYNTFNQDSLNTSLIAYDTLGKKLSEEVKIHFITSRKAPEPFNISSTPPDSEKITDNFKMEFLFSKPVVKTDFDSLFFRYDSLNLVFIDPDKDLKWNATKDQLTLEKRLDKNMAKIGSSEAIPQQGNRNLSNTSNDGGVELYIAKGTFISIENDSNKLMSKKFKFLNTQEVGSIEGNVMTDKPSYIIQLLDKNYKIVSEIKNRKKYRFENVKPGDYQIRILIDNNEDGIWTPGDITEFREPEDVFFFEEMIQIRANWERNDVNISF